MSRYLGLIIRPISSLKSRFQWYNRERKFLTFLGEIKDLKDKTSKSEEIFIIVQPWLLTPLPWYLISLAIAFHFYGKRVCIIWDDTCFGADNWYERFQQNSISHIIRKMPKYIGHLRLSDSAESSEKLASTFQVHHLVRKNKTIQYRGEVFPKESKQLEISTEKSLKKTAGHIASLLENHRPAYIVIGGGGYRSSGLWMDIAKSMKIRVATIDSGFSILLLSTDGIAANLDDIPRAFQMLPIEDDWVIDEAKSELKRRMFGKDLFNSQNVPATGEKYSYGIVLPLNQSYDLSALERHNVFKNQTEWILETVAWVLNNTLEKVVIRRHPVERHKGFASNDDYRSRLKERFGDNDRICFIDSDAPVNTYDLIEQARVVVTYVSTVGIEAAALGKVVVTEGSNCYANLGFVWGARNKEQYFDYLSKAVNGKLEINNEQIDDAWRCYYLTQVCNWHHTIFTPQASDFDKWVIENPEELLNRQEVIDVIDAIDKNIPLSIIAHNCRKEAKVKNV